MASRIIHTEEMMRITHGDTDVRCVGSWLFRLLFCEQGEENKCTIDLSYDQTPWWAADVLGLDHGTLALAVKDNVFTQPDQSPPKLPTWTESDSCVVRVFDAGVRVFTLESTSSSSQRKQHIVEGQ